MPDFSFLLNLIQGIEYLVKLFQWVRYRILLSKVSSLSREVALAYHRYSWEYLIQPVPTVSTIGTIDRLEIGEIVNIWSSSGRPILLKGEGGTGKTGIAICLAQKLANEGMPVLFIRATDLSKTIDPALFIQQRMSINTTLGNSFSQLASERKFALIVDQLDTVSGSEACKGLVSLLRSAVGISNINILAVSRSYEAENDPDISTLQFQVVESSHLLKPQVKQYLALLGIENPTHNIVDLAENLLNLSLIADVAKLKKNNLKDVSQQVELWMEYFRTIQVREGNEVASFLLTLAREKTSKGESSFSVPMPYRKPWTILLSRGILVEVMGKRLAFKHERIQEFMCAYSVFPEDPTSEQLLKEFGSFMPRNIVSWLQLLYHENNSTKEPSFVATMLAEKNGFPFFTRVSILDNLRAQTDSTSQMSNVVANILADLSYCRYFFNELENPFWAPILEKERYFLKAPEIVEVKKDSYMIPSWPAATYLAKVAKSVPDTIVSVVRNIETDNFRVRELLLDALVEIPPQDAVLVLEKIIKWLPSPFADFIPIKYGYLIEKWLPAGYVAEAILLYEALITPTTLGLDKKSESLYRAPLRFVSDHYWINEVVQKQYFSLLGADCEGLLAAYERQVIHYIELAEEIIEDNVEIFTGYRWRLDIPFRSSTSSELDLYDLLIEGLRDALVTLCEKVPEKGREKLLLYINSSHMILKRLGMFALRKFGAQNIDLVEQVIGNRDYLEDSIFNSEYIGLLRNQFGLVSKELQQAVIAWVLEGPLVAQEQLDTIEATDEQRQSEIDRWTIRYFSLIYKYLPDESKAKFDDLTAKYGVPDMTETPTISASVSWGGVPSPVSVEELTKLSFDGLFDLLITYKSENSFESSIESLAQEFGKVVQNDPIKYRDFAYRLIAPGIRNIYIYNYLNGFGEAIKNGKEKLEEALVFLCEKVVEGVETPSEKSNSYEINLTALHLEVARLFDTVFRSAIRSNNDLYLEERLLSRVKKVLFSLAVHSDPLPGDENGSFDPLTQSLNCVRGVALHAIMRFSLYSDTQRKKTSEKGFYKPFIDADVLAILEDKLDVAKDPSLAVHSVFGAYLPQLYYLEQDWVKLNIGKIFPVAVDQFVYWRASWDAYIFSSNVYGDVFELLVRDYQRATMMLSEPKVDGKTWMTSDERLAQHIMFIYINGFTDFVHENNLLNLFFDNASDETRSRAIFWLSKAFENSRPAKEDKLWTRLWNLWRVRVEAANASETPSDFRHEISNYLRWLANVPVDLEYLNDILRKSIRFLESGYYVQLVASFASEQCEKYPYESMSLVYDVIKSAKEPWWSPDKKDEEIVLRTAMASGNPSAKELAIEVINYRGEQGDFRWKYLLE